MSALLQQLLGFFRRHPFVIICSALSILLWVANYFIWQRHQELAASHQTLQRNGEDMLQSLTNHSRITAELATVKEALGYIEANMIHEGDLPENMGYFYQLEAASRIRLQALNQRVVGPREVRENALHRRPADGVRRVDHRLARERARQPADLPHRAGQRQGTPRPLHPRAGGRPDHTAAPT